MVDVTATPPLPLAVVVLDALPAGDRRTDLVQQAAPDARRALANHSRYRLAWRHGPAGTDPADVTLAALPHLFAARQSAPVGRWIADQLGTDPTLWKVLVRFDRHRSGLPADATCGTLIGTVLALAGRYGDAAPSAR